MIWALSLLLTLGNDSKVDGLVNFEKLRMIAKEIRHVGRMAAVNMDPALMFRTRWVLSWSDFYNELFAFLPDWTFHTTE